MANEPQAVKVIFNGNEVAVFEGWTGEFPGQPADVFIQWKHVVVAVLGKAGVRSAVEPGDYELRMQDGTVLDQNAAVPFPPPETFMTPRPGKGG